MTCPFEGKIPIPLFLESAAHAVLLGFWQTSNAGLVSGCGLYSSADELNGIVKREGVVVVLHSGEAHGAGAKVIPSAIGMSVWPHQ